MDRQTPFEAWKGKKPDVGHLRVFGCDIEYTKAVIYEDNQSAIAIAKNPQFHGRTKHIAIKYYYIREQVNDGTVSVKYCSTENMLADMLTKPLASIHFSKLCLPIGVEPSLKVHPLEVRSWK